MASITIEIGALTSTVESSDVRAQTVVDNVAAAREITGTDQEILDQIVEMLSNYLTNMARSHTGRIAEEAARDEAGSDPDNEWRN